MLELSDVKEQNFYRMPYDGWIDTYCEICEDDIQRSKMCYNEIGSNIYICVSCLNKATYASV